MAEQAGFDDEKVRKFLATIRKAASNPGQLQKLVDAFSAIVYGDVMDHFKKESGPDGSWKAWSSMYAQHMKRVGRGDNKKLQWSGRLRQNFRPESDRTVTDKTINWFNNAKTKSGYPYAWGHDSGDGKLPQRQFMWLSSKAQDKMASVAWDIILKETDGV